MSLILGIDTATNGCSVAVADGKLILSHASSRMARGQSEALAPMMERVLSDAELRASDLDAVAVTRGPGAFTGLRIGLASARALALSINKPCIGVTTFDVLLRQVLAANVADESPDAAILIAVESKRDDFFVALFDMDGTQTCPPMALSPGEIQAILDTGNEMILAGDGVEAVTSRCMISGPHRILDDITIPDARFVVAAGRQYLAHPENSPPMPLYLRAPDVTLPNSA